MNYFWSILVLGTLSDVYQHMLAEIALKTYKEQHVWLAKPDLHGLVDLMVENGFECRKAVNTITLTKFDDAGDHTVILRLAICA